MPTYVYETLPNDSEVEPIRYEIQQRITEDALIKHPKTGQPIRRIITGGALISSGKSESSGERRCCTKKSCCG